METRDIENLIIILSQLDYESELYNSLNKAIGEISHPERKRIMVCIDGGVVQATYADNDENIDLFIVDCDTVGMSDDEIKEHCEYQFQPRTIDSVGDGVVNRMMELYRKEIER